MNILFVHSPSKVAGNYVYDAVDQKYQRGVAIGTFAVSGLSGIATAALVARRLKQMEEAEAENIVFETVTGQTVPQASEKFYNILKEEKEKT